MMNSIWRIKYLYRKYSGKVLGLSEFHCVIVGMWLFFIKKNLPNQCTLNGFSLTYNIKETNKKKTYSIWIFMFFANLKWLLSFCAKYS